ncbi:MAG: hypothetical protein LLF89_03360 [Spirochaetaceae bacterium]|nr:hypothetical protein [Spirochaetaceae bacterium]
MKRLGAFLVFALLLASSAAAQSNLATLILGKWLDTDLMGISPEGDYYSVSTNLNEMEKSIKAFSKYLHYYAFRDDGTGESIFVYSDKTNTYKFTWEVLYDEHHTSKKEKEYYVQITSSDKSPSVQKFYFSKSGDKTYIIFNYNTATLISDISKWERVEDEEELQDETNVF